MAFLDHEGGAEFPFDKMMYFEALVNAIKNIKGIEVNKVDMYKCFILVKSG